MVRNLFIFLLIALCPLAAQAKPSIAILDFDIEKSAIVVTDDFIIAGTIEDRTKMLSSELITVLVNTRKFDVIERDRINSVLQEQDFNNSGMVDDQHAIQIGKLIGTDYMVMGKVEVVRAAHKSKDIAYTDYVKHTTTGDMIVNMRIIDTKTGQIVSAKKVKTHIVSDGNQPGEVFFDQLKEDTVKRMVVEVIDGVFPIKVVGSTPEQVFLNRGAGAASFSVGQKLDVYQIGENLIDPDTGDSMGNMETKIAEVVVSSIQPKKSVAQIINLMSTDIPVGSICRMPVDLGGSQVQSAPANTPQKQKAPTPNW